MCMRHKDVQTPHWDRRSQRASSYNMGATPREMAGKSLDCS